MIDKVKGFLQVHKDTTGKVAIVKYISYHSCEAYERMISQTITSKNKLAGRQYSIYHEKVVNQIYIGFSYNIVI